MKASRKNKTPPQRLTRSLLHSSQIPTALGNPADHWYLPVLGRWVSPTEAARLFGVPSSSRLYRAIAGELDYGPHSRSIPIAASGLLSAFGRSIHYGCASRALDIAIDLAGDVSHNGIVRYGSACSGLDMFATAVESRFGDQFRYCHASEWRSSIRKALLFTYEDRGLVPSRVHKDARVMSCFYGPVDIWSFTPPCEPFSKRNHKKNDPEVDAEELVKAGEQIHSMLWYPRLYRPRIILVENVCEHAATTIISSMLLSLPGYDWVTLETEARDYSESCRRRRLWIGIREA